MEILELYKIFKKCGAVTTDSRKISGGELFFALKGENFDGNEYALKALEAGAAYAVVDEKSEAAKIKNQGIIPVPDTVLALQDLARWHRQHALVNGKPITVVGLTGTNGKTTTKELIRTVLAAKYNVSATEGNFNNSIGVPLTLLKIRGEAEIAVVEMGANHPDDIKELVNVCQPDCGLITCVGTAHLLGFGDLEGVKRAKGALYDYLAGNNGFAFVNSDDNVLVEMAEARANLKTVPYGLAAMKAKVLPSSAEHPFLRMEISSEGEIIKIETHLVGAYNASNVLAAIAVGQYFGVPAKSAAEAINAYIPANNRSQMMKTERNTLIVDAYNANPMSMAAALDSFDQIEAASKVLCLGNMGELGAESVAEHVKLLRRLECGKYSRIILVGEQFSLALQQAGKLSFEPEYFATSDEAAQNIIDNPVSGATILIKGSRSTAMEKVIPTL